MTVTAPYKSWQWKCLYCCLQIPSGSRRCPMPLPGNHTVQGDIRTFTFCDPWMRRYRVKKDAMVVCRGSSQPLVVSGRIVYDAFDRTHATYSTTTESPSIATQLSAPPLATMLATTRVWCMGSRRQDCFGWRNGQFHELPHSRTCRRADVASGKHRSMGRKTEVDRSARSRPLFINHASGDVKWTMPLWPGGRPAAGDPPQRKKITTYLRWVFPANLPSATPTPGKTVYTYDAAGSLLTRLTASWLPAQAAMQRDKIHLTMAPGEVLYPRISTTVWPTLWRARRRAQPGRTALFVGGRRWRHWIPVWQDGRVTRTVRSIIVNEVTCVPTSAAQRYDSWNRLMGMVYPDGESDLPLWCCGQPAGLGQPLGWQLARHNHRHGLRQKDGHVVYQRMGNGTVSVCWLRPAPDAPGRNAGDHSRRTADAQYLYLRQGGQHHADEQRCCSGGSLHRQQLLPQIMFTTNWTDWRQPMAYVAKKVIPLQWHTMPWSSPTGKTQTISTGGKSQTVNQRYGYEGSHPDAVTDIAGTDSAHYVYDANGNLTTISGTDSSTREILWDEENRIRAIDDDGYVSRYTYDASGTRVVKSHGPMEGIYINGMAQGILYHDEDHFTIYVSPYLAQTNGRITKHYYADLPVASKIDGGDFNNIYGVSNSYYTAGRKDYSERMAQIEQGKTDYYSRMVWCRVSLRKRRAGQAREHARGIQQHRAGWLRVCRRAGPRHPSSTILEMCPDHPTSGRRPCQSWQYSARLWLWSQTLPAMRASSSIIPTR